VKHVAWGFTLMVDGERERRFSSEWATKEQAWEELRRRSKDVEAGQRAPRAAQTLGQVAAEYLCFKTDNGKRSIEEDRRILKRQLLPAFGAELLVRDLRGNLIAQYERRRVGQVRAFTVRNELTVLRHLLRLAKRRRAAKRPDWPMSWPIVLEWRQHRRLTSRKSRILLGTPP
jgi:hypothetical protein